MSLVLTSHWITVHRNVLIISTKALVSCRRPHQRASHLAVDNNCIFETSDCFDETKKKQQNKTKKTVCYAKVYQRYKNTPTTFRDLP